MKKVIIIIVLIIFTVFTITFKGCINKEKEISKENKVEETKNINEKIISSDLYLLGKWNIQYLDIVHYEYDDIGMPLVNLYKQPSNYTFSHVKDALILEEEYPIVESQYNDQQFNVKIDLKIVYLIIKGEIIDNNKWEGYFEYIGDQDRIYSKCKVVGYKIN